MVPLQQLVQWLDDTLQASSVPDYPNAHNGLQVSNRGEVTKVGAAVDASLRTIEQAAAQGVDLLIVHHGLYWQGVERLTGAWRKKVALLLEHDIAVYSSHLPLDIHPLYGNNAVLSQELGLRNCEPCFPWKGIHLGLVGELGVELDGLLEHLATILGQRPFASPNGSEYVERLCLSSGGAGSHVGEIAALQCDTFLSGEGSHWTVPYAEDNQLNLIYGGHYLTETFGVRKISDILCDNFALPSIFLPSVTFL